MKTKEETKRIITALAGAHEAMRPAALLLMDTCDAEAMEHGLELGSATVMVGDWINALLKELDSTIICGNCGELWENDDDDHCKKCGAAAGMCMTGEVGNA